jgi:cobyrinic acid a,c-diamide synthase
MPSNESHVATSKIKQIGEAIAEQVDLDKLLALSQKEPLAVPHQRPLSNSLPEGERANVKKILQFPAIVSPLPCGEKVKIGIARDRAFGFYYADDLEALEAAGAELVPFDALRDAQLPEVDALYIGGGFPETCATELEANVSLRSQIKQAIDNGMPAYAECGGLMYLSRSMNYEGRTFEMVGAIPGDVKMHSKPIGRGYVHLKEDECHPWPRPDKSTEMPSPQSSPVESPLTNFPPQAGERTNENGNLEFPGRGGKRENQPLILAHEFHYSSLENLPPDSRFAYHVERGYGIDGDRDGLILHNLLASYTHLRTIGSCYWATRFVAFIRRCKEQQTKSTLTIGKSL